MSGLDFHKLHLAQIQRLFRNVDLFAVFIQFPDAVLSVFDAGEYGVFLRNSILYFDGLYPRLARFLLEVMAVFSADPEGKLQSLINIRLYIFFCDDLFIYYDALYREQVVVV